jgi:hypothetical protein
VGRIFGLNISEERVQSSKPMISLRGEDFLSVAK